MHVVGAIGGAEVIGFLAAWIASIVLTGWMADRRGRSVVGWGLLAVVITLWAFVIVVLLPSKKAETEPPAAARPGDHLAELADLHDSGLLTDDEFEAKKAKLLTHA